MKKVEYSQIARQKLHSLKSNLANEFSSEVSRKAIKQITTAVKGLEEFAEKGASVSAMYDIDCDYRYLHVGYNYIFYRIENDKVIIVEMFDEREDFIYKLFGIATLSQDFLD